LNIHAAALELTRLSHTSPRTAAHSIP